LAWALAEGFSRPGAAVKLHSSLCEYPREWIVAIAISWTIDITGAARNPQAAAAVVTAVAVAGKAVDVQLETPASEEPVMDQSSDVNDVAT
jgi:hypothetical protein